MSLACWGCSSSFWYFALRSCVGSHPPRKTRKAKDHVGISGSLVLSRHLPRMRFAAFDPLWASRGMTPSHPKRKQPDCDFGVDFFGIGGAGKIFSCPTEILSLDPIFVFPLRTCLLRLVHAKTITTQVPHREHSEPCHLRLFEQRLMDEHLCNFWGVAQASTIESALNASVQPEHAT